MFQILTLRRALVQGDYYCRPVLSLAVLAKLDCSLIVLAWPHVVLVVIVYPLVILVYPHVALVSLLLVLAYLIVVLICPLVVLVLPVVISAGLFITDQL